MQQPDALTDTQTGHAIARCKGCGRSGRIPFTITTTTRAYLGRPHISQSAEINGRTYTISYHNPFAHVLHRQTSCTCPAPKITVKPVKGIYTADKPCDARCIGAVGPACSCACAGANHGRAHGAW